MEHPMASSSPEFQLNLPLANLTLTEGRQMYEEYNSLPETVIFGIYAMVSVVLGFGGNFIVILATLRYTVFSLDSITMVFVRHLAIADMLYIGIRVFPAVTVHLGRGWVLGRGLCFLQANLVTISSISSMNFILTISIHRLLRCMFPLRFSLSVRNKATVLAVIIWAYSCIGAMMSLFLRIDVHFRPSNAACDVNYTTHQVLAIVSVVLWMLIPFFGIILLNLSMYAIARKRFKDLSNNQALMTVACVSGLFVISWLPSILIIFLSVAGVEQRSLIWLDKLQINFYFLSVFGNPVLYSLVHKGFGKFARSKFSIFLRRCQNSVEAQWAQSVSRSSEPVERADASCEKPRSQNKNMQMGELVNEALPASQDHQAAKDENSRDSGLCSTS